MKAVVCTKYGTPDFLEIRDIPRPTPKDNEVLVKVMATPATTADTMMRRGVPKFARLFLGLTRPKKEIIGTGFAGIIAAVGKEVTRFQPGDRVFGETGLNFGAYAEYACVAQHGALTAMPATSSFDEVAPLGDGAMTVMNFLTVVANLQLGQKILIIGASGGLGTAAVQLARYLGAEVTAVCSTQNRELVTSLGAAHVIDYTRQDFAQSGQTFDIIFDTVGKSSFSHSKRALTRNGLYLSPVLTLPLLLQMLRTSLVGNKKAKFSATGLLPAPELRKFLDQIKRLMEDGALKTVIDRSYPLDKIAQAHRYVDKGHKRGNVIVSVG